MQHFLIEGGDVLGKNSLIKRICEYYNYDNNIIRHFTKPPKTIINKASFEYQIMCFEKEGQLLNTILQLEKDQYNYFENIMLWNRSIYGEYVYGQMFRGENPSSIEKYIKLFEKKYLLNNPKTYLILLTADSDFFLSKEDGKSFSQNIEQKTKELKLFNDIFNKSAIDNKIKIKVNDGMSFIPKENIFNQVLNFIK